MKMIPDDWEALLYSINKQKCIPVLGPELVTENISGTEMSIANSLAKFLSKDKEFKGNRGCIDNLRQVAQQYHINKKLSLLHSKADEFYSSKELLQPQKQLLEIASLPFSKVIYSTPDNQLYKSFKLVGKNPKREWYSYRGEVKDHVTEGTVQEPLIYHLYGSILDPESIVLSESELLDFLVAIISKKTLPKNIKSIFTENENSVLFLGFGFDHWYLRVMMHVFEKNAGSSSFALEQIDKATIEDFEQTILFFQQRFTINIYNDDLFHFVSEMKRGYEEKYKDKQSLGANEIEIPPDAPLVFLSHLSENKEFTQDLSKKMNEKGIKTWIAENDIEGGDIWSPLIERVIRKDINYFLVLQSKALNERFENVVNREVKWALRRYDDFDREFKFIIPTKIEDCKLLELLQDDFNTLDISKQEGIDALIQTIRRDWEKRKKKRG